MSEEKIKILYVINDLQVGGAENIVMNYMRELQNDEDIEPSLLLFGPSYGSIFDREASDKHFDVKYLNFKRIRCPVKGVNWLRAEFTIWNGLRKMDPDIIHIHETGHLKYGLLPIVSKRKAVHIHTLHGTPSLYSPILSLFAKAAFRVFHFYPICIIEEQAERAVKKYGFKDYTLIHNGIDISRYSIEETKESIRNSLGISDDDFIVGAVAGLRPIKNFDFMFRIFASFSAGNQKAKLLIAGDGEEREHLENLTKELGIDDKVIFLGVRNDVERIYKAMDVFIMTSFSEASPIVFVEAQLSGCRCVVSSAVPASAVFTDKVTILSLDDDEKKWIDALNGQLPFEAIKCKAEDFSMETFIEKTKNLYSSLMQHR